jgi:hypothetical protein
MVGINSICPFCGSEQQLPKSLRGQRVTCHACKAAYTVDANVGIPRSKATLRGLWRRTTILWFFAAVLFIACVAQHYRLNREDLAAIKEANDNYTETLRLRELVGGPYPLYREPPPVSRSSVFFLAGAGMAFFALGVTCLPGPRAKDD